MDVKDVLKWMNINTCSKWKVLFIYVLNGAVLRFLWSDDLIWLLLIKHMGLNVQARTWFDHINNKVCKRYNYLRCCTCLIVAARALQAVFPWYDVNIPWGLTD